jgi:hypothetical protein
VPSCIKHRTRVPQRTSDKAPQHTETVIPHVCLYKSDLASPSRYNSLSHTFLHTPLISHTDLIVRVLTCLQTPFVPSWDYIATAMEHRAVTVVTIHHHRTNHILLCNSFRDCLVLVKEEGWRAAWMESLSIIGIPLFGLHVRVERKPCIGGSHNQKPFPPELRRKCGKETQL